MRLLRATWALSVPALVLAALWFVSRVTAKPAVALDDAVPVGTALAVIAVPVLAGVWTAVRNRCTPTYGVTLALVLGGATWDGGGRASLWLTAIVAHAVMVIGLARRFRSGTAPR